MFLRNSTGGYSGCTFNNSVAVVVSVIDRACNRSWRNSRIPGPGCIEDTAHRAVLRSCVAHRVFCCVLIAQAGGAVRASNSTHFAFTESSFTGNQAKDVSTAVHL